MEILYIICTQVHVQNGMIIPYHATLWYFVICDLCSVKSVENTMVIHDTLLCEMYNVKCEECG